MRGMLVSSLMFSSTLFGGVAMAQELGAGEVLRVLVEDAAYCHMKFPALREDSLCPLLDESLPET